MQMKSNWNKARQSMCRQPVSMHISLRWWRSKREELVCRRDSCDCDLFRRRKLLCGGTRARLPRRTQKSTIRWRALLSETMSMWKAHGQSSWLGRNITGNVTTLMDSRSALIAGLVRWSVFRLDAFARTNVVRAKINLNVVAIPVGVDRFAEILFIERR